MLDVLVIGGGPAGVSAALTVRSRGRQAAIVSSALEDIPLYKARRVDNYPGMPRASGREILETMRRQAEEAGVTWITGRALSAMHLGDHFGVAVGSDFYAARALILATGVSQAKPYPGEAEFLGRGVSYCATCDGMFYRDREVAVIGLCSQAAEEAEFLRSIGCRVRYFEKRRPYVITGTEQVEALSVDGERFPVSAVFILRSAVAASALLPGLALEGPHIAVDRHMAASLPGVYACGDCVGKPYQLPKAVGEGNLAALQACADLEARDRGKGD